MRLRRAGSADVAKLSLIGCATFLETFANDHDGDQVVDYLADEHAPEHYAVMVGGAGAAAWLVEEAAGCPVGYALALPATLPGCDPAADYELKRLYMLSKWHGGGWGAKLYAAAEAEARAYAARRIVLSVYVTNFPARRFYEARGFQVIGRWLFKGFEGSEDLILAKTL